MAISLNFLNLLITERYESTGRVADDVSGEIAGPLNDIITQASTLMEEYIGHDDLRQRLGAICENVTAIKKLVKEPHRLLKLFEMRGVLARRNDKEEECVSCQES